VRGPDKVCLAHLHTDGHSGLLEKTLTLKTWRRRFSPQSFHVKKKADLALPSFLVFMQKYTTLSILKFNFPCNFCNFV